MLSLHWVIKMKNIKIIILAIVMALSGVSYVAAGEFLKKYDSEKAEFKVPFGRGYDYGDILVARVIDGDTLQLEDGERVRLIGIDTPEMHDSQKLERDSRRTKQSKDVIQELGRRSYEFTKKLVEGKRVGLDFDVEPRDKYKRLLAYVYLQDGTFVNAEIVKQGYASLLTFPPNVKHADLFAKLYREARENKQGLWAD